jgi:hypothetical protein
MELEWSEQASTRIVDVTREGARELAGYSKRFSLKGSGDVQLV